MELYSTTYYIKTDNHQQQYTLRLSYTYDYNCENSMYSRKVKRN